MRLVPLPRERWQKFAGEFAKFGTIGVVNAVVNYAVFNALILTVFAEGQLKANVIATVVATTGSYFMNRHWTYRHRPKSAVRREYALFFFFNLAGLVIELGVLALAKYGLGLTGVLALNVFKTVGMVLGTAFRFWAYRTFVFPVSSAPASAQAAVLARDGEFAVPTGQVGVAREFNELTAPLEAEFAHELDTDVNSRAGARHHP